MTEQTTPQGTWMEGGSVDSMSGDEAKAEIKNIEKDPSFAGDGKMDYWSRQRMLRRRDSLYRQAYPENVGKEYSGMEETLRNQGIDETFLENETAKLGERDYQEERVKAMDALTRAFGGEEEAKKGILQARSLLNRFAGPEDLVFLEDSGLGNSPDLISALATVARIFERGGKK